MIRLPMFSKFAIFALLILAAFFALFFAAPEAHAETVISCPIEGGEGGIVPCGRQCDDPTTPIIESAQCAFCHFFYLSDNIINFVMFRILPGLAVLLIVWAGLLLVTARGSSGQMDLGKKILLWVVVGYAIAFLGWMVLNSFFTIAGLKKWTGIVGESGNFDFVDAPITAPVTFKDSTKSWEGGEWVNLAVEINHPSWSGGPQIRQVATSTADSITVKEPLPEIVGLVSDTTYTIGGWWQFACGVSILPVVVKPPPLGPSPPTVNLSVLKNPISEDEFIDLSWTVTGASTCEASGAWSGARSAICSPTCSERLLASPPSDVCPPYTLDYTLECSGPGGTAESSVDVVVTESDPGVRTPSDIRCESELGPPIVMLLSTPEIVSEGDPSALVTYAVKAESCELEGAPQALCWPACYDIVHPEPGGFTYTYEVSCTNASGTASDAASVGVATVTPPNSWVGVWEEQRSMRPGPRVGHATVVFTDPTDGKEKLWLMGGLAKDEDGNDVFKNDVWSYDGERWTFEGNAGWEPRAYHAAVAYNGKIWMLGGGGVPIGTFFTNEVWSFDGTTWTEVIFLGMKWSGRGGHAALVFTDPSDGMEKIWVMGGKDLDGIYREDVWVFNGTSWEVKGGADWIGRAYHAAVVFADPADGNKKKMWVMGGSQPAFLSDVWVSLDGVAWERRDDAPWSGRMDHAVAVLQDKIWVMGGLSNDGFKNDVWSFTGITWEPKSNAKWLGRIGHRAAVMQDPVDGVEKIWVTGGSVTEGDMWTFNGANWIYRLDHRWSQRMGHTAVTFVDPADSKEKIWVLGGVDVNGIYKNDIWVSDGIIWEEKIKNAAWPPRAYHASVVYNGEMWVMGGSNPEFRNDVWSSPDGINWTRRDPFLDDNFDLKYWERRRGHRGVVFVDPDDGIEKMWILGGLSATGTGFRNDVWNSADGIDWTQRLPIGPVWKERYFHAAVSHEGKIWVMGGISSAGYHSDVWSSDDGASWTETSAAWAKRAGHAAVTFLDPFDTLEKIWVLGGQDSPSTYRNDVWSSALPPSWGSRGDAGWVPRTNHASVVFTDPRDGKEKVWILGGLSEGGALNDVWYAPKRY